MSRNITRILMAVLVLNAIAVASTMLWPNIAHSTGSQASMTAVDFDHTFNSVTAAPRRADTPAASAAVDFDKVFTSVSAPHRMNTPPNRERLRNIGWRRILGS
jgi:hypothetical protein